METRIEDSGVPLRPEPPTVHGPGTIHPCPVCGGDLEPATLGANWTCTSCQALYSSCFFCSLVSARHEASGRSCQNSGCSAHLKLVQQCSACQLWTLPDPPGAEGCLSPVCPSRGAVTLVHPAATTPLPNGTCVPVTIDILLDHIASQSHFEERYELGDRLFVGGMGEIWHAYDRVLGRHIAIKLAQPCLADNPLARGQFLKEAKVVGRLLHPNILPVFDLGVNRERRIYFTMRFVNGASLQSSLDAVAMGCATNLVDFPLKRVIGAFVRACHGVDFAHQHGVIHLDLKPQNVLVSGFHEVFVIDWGLAYIDGEDDTERLLDLYSGRCDTDFSTHCGRTSSGGRIIGTPGYMAPEQVSGDYRSFTPATDVFGLGGVLYFILYGHPPCRPPEVTDIFQALQLAREPQRPGKLRHGILPRGERVKKELRESIDALERICLKALERDPTNRFSSVEDLIIDLNDWLRQAAGSAFRSDPASLW